ncbi:MAG: DoxX family protein [Chitinophagaceae bacterium]
MKKIKIIYWISTGLLAALMLMSSIPDIIVTPEAVAVFKQLGYPVYLIPFMGVAKFLGVVAILVPGNTRLKEWAYAGFVFDIAGAVYSTISIGAPVSMWAPVLIIAYTVIAVSYIYHHKKRKAAEQVIDKATKKYFQPA